MNVELATALLEQGLGQTVVAISPVMGGDSHHAFSVTVGEGEQLFAKCNVGVGAAALETEFASLQALHALGAHWYPRPITVQRDGDFVVLCLEYLDLHRPENDQNAAQMGQLLALQHQITSANYGWPTDNHIGRTPQTNTEHADWVTFYRERRLAPQLTMAVRRGLAREVEVQVRDLMSQLACLIEVDVARPALLHGDLWAGNASITRQGKPIFYDPAPYFGDPMADIAMTRLFGGFPHAFYSAYHELMPRRHNFTKHCKIYDLYHALNHFNLFGSGYLPMIIRCLN
ncbi:fructosamine kinase family protein [Arenicella chitinivorans]|uniref:Fructosamine kinase family protein n=1 Tax=Arenicella chitinivorans TaxID=1329800 RepID=A0A918RXB0_9GAMM|nr:fructosamine kinase family protein [Arenicella chitinivorans]GHA13042.1 fructosamine kinase family protein [Arenicella chitinivorans]